MSIWFSGGRKASHSGVQPKASLVWNIIEEASGLVEQSSENRASGETWHGPLVKNGN